VAEGSDPAAAKLLQELELGSASAADDDDDAEKEEEDDDDDLEDAEQERRWYIEQHCGRIGSSCSA
jgi:hypothetical protein